MAKTTSNGIADFITALAMGMLPPGTPRWYGLAVLGIVAVGALAVLYFSAIPLLLS